MSANSDIPGVEVRIEERNGLALVIARGEIDLATVDELALAVDPTRHQSSRGVIADLRSVSFMDSSGLAVIMRAAAALDGRFSVVLKPGSAVERLFSITGVLDGMLTFSDPDEAESVMREIERAP